MATWTTFGTVDEGTVSKNFNDALDSNLSLQRTTSTTTLSGPGALPITEAIVEWTTTGADAGTLADGSEGQHIYIILVVDGGTGTLTPANAGGYTSIAFADAGDSVHLLFTNGAWYMVGHGGIAGGPVAS